MMQTGKLVGERKSPVSNTAAIQVEEKAVDQESKNM
jgi:hypothetical protein